MKGGEIMDLKNWKTSLAGLLMAAPQILPLVGLAIPVPVIQILTALGALLLYFAKDKNVSGGSK